MLELVSIIIPVYNGEKCIKKCIESLLSQDYKNLEIIIVDNGSFDDTEMICSAIQETERRIIYIKESRKGVSNARNRGLTIAKGQYICFIDADDWVEPNYISSLLNSFDKDIDVVCCDFIDEYADNSISKRSYSKPTCDLVCRTPEDKLKALDNSYIFTYTIWCKIFRKAAIGDFRFVDLAYSEDTVFFRNFFFTNIKIKYITYRGYHYFINRNSVTTNNLGRSIEITQGLLEVAFITWKFDKRNRGQSTRFNNQIVICAKKYIKSIIRKIKLGNSHTRMIVSVIMKEMLKGGITFDIEFLIESIPFCLISFFETLFQKKRS